MTAAAADVPSVSGMPGSASTPSPVRNKAVRAWIEETSALLRPDRVHYCDGTKAERDALYAQGVADGTFVQLNQKKWPGCYFHRSNSNDVAAYRASHVHLHAQPGRGWSDQ